MTCPPPERGRSNEPNEKGPDAERLRSALLRERERALKRIRTVDAASFGRSLTESIGELSAYDNHPADAATATSDRACDLGLRDNARRTLREIDAALARMDRGSYGLCQRCGGPIEGARLRVLPYASLCLECQRTTERERPHARRPVEEEVLSHELWEALYEDTRRAGADDAWEGVTSHGTSESEQDRAGALDTREGRPER